MGSARRAVVAMVLALLVGTAAPASTASGVARPVASTVRVSVDVNGQDANGGSTAPSVSTNGRFVAFASDAGDLSPQTGNPSYPDVYRRDQSTGATVLVSVDSSGGNEEAGSSAPSIDGSGDLVAFHSFAKDIVSNDLDGTADVFVRNLTTGVTSQVSRAADGGDPDGRSSFPAISADGTHVAFESYATNLVAGVDGNGSTDVFVRDLGAATTSRASVDTAGGDPDGSSFDPAVSSDGRYVAFDSFATDLVAGDRDRASDVFVRDLQAGVTTRVSVDTAGGDPNEGSFDPAVSSDGRYVAFWSYASDLVDNDSNGRADVFLRDRQAGTTVRVSVGQQGSDPNGPSFDPSISADGRFVSYRSEASNLVRADGNGRPDVFVWDRVNGSTTRASADQGGQDADGASFGAAIAPDGTSVAFWSQADDLVGGDGNGLADVFLRTLGPSAQDARRQTPTGKPDAPTGGVVLGDHGTRFGAFVDLDPHTGLDRRQGMANLEGLIGHKLAVERVYYSWDQAFPTEDDEWSRDQGHTLILSWTSYRSDGTPVRWADIASGVYDGELHAMASRVKAFGAPLFLTFHHEPDGHHQEIEEQVGTAPEYVAAWRHIHDLFAADGATNVTWTWILMSWTFYQPRADIVGEDYWPGSDYVDAVGTDGYNWWGCAGHNGPWRSPREVFEPWYEYALTKGKPLVISEWASGEDQATPGRKGQWMDETMNLFKSWPEIKAVAYFETANRQNDCARWVDTSGSSLSAFGGMATDPYFNPIPDATITSGPSAHTIGTDATFTFASSTQGSTFICSLDGGPAARCSSPRSYSGLALGAHTFSVTPKDGEGNVGNPVTWLWSVDPIVASIDQAPDSTSASTSATFAFGATDPQATFTCSLDGVESSCVSPTTYTGLAAADHDFSVRADDGQGNVSSPQVWDWTVVIASATVSVRDNVFVPRQTRIGPGESVAWSFDGLDSHTVTDGSGLGLFDSGLRPSSSSFAFTGSWAGAFRYVCTVHPAMRGQLLVQPDIEPPSGGVTTHFAITYAGAPSQPGQVVTIQIKRPGSSGWAVWRFGQTAGIVDFIPDGGTGTYSFRVRLESSVTGAASAYSQPVSIEVS